MIVILQGMHSSVEESNEKAEKATGLIPVNKAPLVDRYVRIQTCTQRSHVNTYSLAPKQKNAPNTAVSPIHRIPSTDVIASLELL